MKKFIIMGGTISSIAANENSEQGFSDIPNYLEKVYKEYPNLCFFNICMKDSRQITDEDRELLVKEIANDYSDQIIVTHGTITMTKTAQFIKKHWPDKRTKKVVCFVGAEFALDVYPTDALLNLGIALEKVEGLKPGVYCYLDGQTVEIK